MKVHELVARFSAAVQGADPMAGGRQVLEALQTDLEAVADALSFLSGTGGNAGSADVTRGHGGVEHANHRQGNEPRP